MFNLLLLFLVKFPIQHQIFHKITGLSLNHLNQPNLSDENNKVNKLPIKIGLQAGYEINMNPYQGNFLPDNSFLFLYTNWSKIDQLTNYFFAQDIQLGSFSLGINQHASFLTGFSFTHLGIQAGISLENFDLGFQYALPLKVPNQVNPPRIFELFVAFDFSPFRRNNRGLFKRLQTDNY